MTLGRKFQQFTGNAGEARKVYASQSKVGTLSGCSSSISLCDMIEPPDWEELCDRVLNEGDVLAYPLNDVELVTVPRPLRTAQPVLPDEPLDRAPMFVRECIRSYSSNFTFVEYKYRSQSGSACSRERRAERLDRLQNVPRHNYEVDVDPLTVSTEELSTHQFESQPSSGRQSVASLSSSSSCNETLTPRGSWASLDLRSSSSDPLLTDLLERRPMEQLDAINEARRLENRQNDFLGLYTPYLDEEEAVERRLAADMPCEVQGHRILVLCHQLKLELDVEPLFASMALYDAKEKKKLSENFHFNLNSECTRQMLSAHLSHADLSTLSRSAVFEILNPSQDIFLVVRLEKVLQGDVNECVEPYVKDDKNREKVRASAQAACSRLGKYRMPFAWTAVSLVNIVTGANNEQPGSTDQSASNSLDRKSSSSSLEQLRRRAGEVGGSLTRKGSERRLMVPADMDDIATHLDTLKPIGITLTSFFKQEVDKLRDEDLYKYLQEIKRPSSAPKKLKCIPGMLKIEICSCPEDIRNVLTPELAKLNPYGDDNVRPCKEILSFPLYPPLMPHYQYRSLLYVCPKEINLNAYTSKTGSARNIAVRIQLMAGEEQSCALPAIFGRSSCPEFTTEAYTTVLYHNKNPSLYDEIKLKLPADLGDQHHLLFTFLHISCQRKPVAPEQEKNLETIVGYSWLPLCRNGKLTCGEFNLPVMVEEPPANYSYIFPEVLLPGTKWIDNHKPLFNLTLDAHSTVHPLDSCIERFAMACEAVQEGNIPARIGLVNMEAELRNSINELPNANVEVLARYLPVVLDKTIQLLTAPPSLQGDVLNIAQDAFTCITQIFTDITNMNEGTTCDSHGRSGLLSTYIQYQASIPRPLLSDRDIGLPLPPTVMTDGSCKILHEELALQWVVASGATRDLAMHNSCLTPDGESPEREPPQAGIATAAGDIVLITRCYLQSALMDLPLLSIRALFELMIKSMVEYLQWSGAYDSPRKCRFPEQFTDDITSLVNNVTSEIISRYGKNSRLTQGLNNSLAFFLFDLLSIMDRGYIFGLIRTYYKQMSAKIASLPDAVPLVHYKLAFLRIVCSHEHYVSLNLPTCTSSSGATSPAPSAASPAPSSISQAPSAASQSGTSSAGHLTADFRQRHYLAALMLTELAADLDIQSPVLQCAAVNAVLSLLTAHDADTRLLAPETKARVAALYLPLIHIVLDAYPQLYRGFHDNKDILQFDGDLNNSGQLFAATSSDNDYKQNVRAPFNSETSRNLLMCLVWVLKWAERSTIMQVLSEMSVPRVITLLQTIDLCFKCQEYKGRKEIMKCTQQNVRKTTDIKSKLEDVILGQGSARSDFIMRRKGVCSAQSSGCRRERWRKEWRGVTREIGLQPDMEAALSAELALVMLHTLELLQQTCINWESGQSICNSVLQVLLRAMQRNQSATVLQHMFATLRALILKLGWSCAESAESAGAGGVCRVVLGHCAAQLPHIRQHASLTLYTLMRHHYHLGNNFSRVKMQVTMSLSSLVGTSTTFSEESLRRSLKTILLYAEQDNEMLDTSFPEQVKDLVFNLHMILSDTVKMKEFQEDPEMLLDLMHRIARGYQHSPDLRLTWLNNMAQKHMERSNHTEAGMCLVHGAALVAEHTCAGARGAQLLANVTHNALHESAAHEVHDARDVPQHLTHLELQALLEHAASELMTAGMYETVNEVYKVLIPIAEEHRDYKKLANIHSKLNEAFTRIEQLHGKRVFGTYFRVGFYGAKFGDLHGEEFVYKEHALTKLPEIFSRLENFYGQRFGTENVVIIKDSNNVDLTTLDPDKAYIQITYVEPYFEPYELRHRVTHYERNHNIKRFMYATPFTLDGRAHGELTEQCKRKTILTTAHHFPYLKTRIQVVQRSQIILSPIEVAIEDIQKKINELAAATCQEPPDPKILQMVVQGCIGTTVNQGPLELAQVFLGPVTEGTAPPTKFTNKLRLAFKDFSKKCQDALRKNNNLIGRDQREYQRELERNYQRFTERLAPMLVRGDCHVQQLSNGVNKHDAYKHQQ